MKFMDKGDVQYYYSMQNQLKDHIYNRAKYLFADAKKIRDGIYTTDELKKYNKLMKAKFIASMGGIALDDTSIDARVTSIHKYDGYKMENVIFKSRKDTYVTGSMYIPDGINAPSAAVLFLHGHSDDARHYPQYQYACETLVKAGLIVFAIDPVGQGERVSYYDNENNKYIIEPCIYDHDAVGISATLTDRTIESYFLCDELRAIDYMCTRPEIDPSRIGVTGNSGAGTQTMALMAVDDRIAAAAPGTFVTSRESYMYSGEPQDSEQIWRGITAFGFDHINPIMNFAPKPLAILTVNYDFFTIEGTRDTVREAERFYDMFGKRENLYWFRDDSLHEYTPHLAAMAAKFFAKHLLGKNIEIDIKTSNEELLANYNLKPIEAFFNTKSGRVRGEINGARFMYDDNVDVAKRLYNNRHSLKLDERLAKAENWLNDVVYANRTPYDFFIRKLKTTTADGYITAPIFWHSQKDIFNFAFMIRDEKLKHEKLPVLVMVWEDGTKAISEHEDIIKRKCSEGYEVMVLDVSGVGYIEAAKINQFEIKEQYATMYKLCCDMMFMDDSIAALRCYDVLRAVEMLKEVYGLAYNEIILYCDGKYGIYGIVAAFLNKNVNVVYSDSLLRNAEDALIKPFARKYDDDLEIIIPGMLEYFDFDEILR